MPTTAPRSSNRDWQTERRPTWEIDTRPPATADPERVAAMTDETKAGRSPPPTPRPQVPWTLVSMAKFWSSSNRHYPARERSVGTEL